MEEQTVTTEKWEAIPDQEYPTVHGIWSKTEFPTYVARTCFASERNANLIAAAPELLAALQDCLNAMNYGDPNEETTRTTWDKIIVDGNIAVYKALGIKE